MTRSGVFGVAAVVVLGSLASACGSDPSSGSQAGSSAESGGAHLDVVASFYPLQYVVQRIGGDLVSVHNLTPAGAEPHDLELTADDTARLTDADLVVYLSGFSAAVDDGVAAVSGDRALDVAPSANLDLSYRPIDEGQQASGTSTDPHFWLDPTRLADVADAVADRLAADAPGDAATFRANAAVLRADLAALDGEMAAGLAHCADTAIVTSHNAFGYLAERYGLQQIGITGLTPEDEPTAQQLADAVDFVEQNDVHTIYYETLVSPAIATTIASETGAATMVLDPIEGLTSASQGSDYLAVMRADLADLRTGQGCT